MRGIDEINIEHLVDLIRGAAKVADESDDPHGWMIKWMRQIVDRSYELDDSLSCKATRDALIVAVLAGTAEVEGYSAGTKGLNITDCPYPQSGLAVSIDPLLPFQTAYWQAGWYAAKKNEEEIHAREASLPPSGFMVVQPVVYKSPEFATVINTLATQFEAFPQSLYHSIGEIIRTSSTKRKGNFRPTGKHLEHPQDLLPGYEIEWARYPDRLDLLRIRVTAQPFLF